MFNTTFSSDRQCNIEYKRINISQNSACSNIAVDSHNNIKFTAQQFVYFYSKMSFIRTTCKCLYDRHKYKRIQRSTFMGKSKQPSIGKVLTSRT